MKIDINNPKKKFIFLIVNQHKKSKTNLKDVLTCFKKSKRKAIITKNISSRFAEPIKYIISVKLTYSNIILNLTTSQGDSKLLTTSGVNYFKGKLKTSRYAALTVSEKFLAEAVEYFKKNTKRDKPNFLVAMHVTGLKKNRKTILRVLKKKLQIKVFKNNTITPHNGCRAPKKKRK